MSDEYIDDGKIHPASREYAYILKFLDQDIIFDCENQILNNFIENSLKEYAEYLIQFEREKILEIIIQHFRPIGIGMHTDENITFGYRPIWNVKDLNQKANLYFKFKRSQNDNLDEKQ